MKKREKVDYFRTAREYFEHLRSQRSKNPSLRVQLTLFVLAEIVFVILLALAFDVLVGDTIFNQWEGTLIVELIVISLVVGGIATSFASKYFFDPTKKLRDAMERVAEGDFTVRLETKSASKEIQELFAGFNMMMQELNSTEILQSDFVSNVSHEFKTPINAIEGYSTLLQDCDNLNPDQREYVEKILFNTKRLSALVGNILLLSKIENQSIQTKHASYSLDEQIRQSIVALESAWTEKNIDFDIDMETVNYIGNEHLMVHVWHNIIGNAIKFSPENGNVKIKLLKKEGKIIFTADDQGIGLSEEAQKHLFDKFYQGDSSHKQEGNGLGLALVKRILVISGGEVKAENLSTGGCRITVIL